MDRTTGTAGENQEGEDQPAPGKLKARIKRRMQADGDPEGTQRQRAKANQPRADGGAIR